MNTTIYLNHVIWNLIQLTNRNKHIWYHQWLLDFIVVAFWLNAISREINSNKRTRAHIHTHSYGKNIILRSTRIADTFFYYIKFNSSYPKKHIPNKKKQELGHWLIHFVRSLSMWKINFFCLLHALIKFLYHLYALRDCVDRVYSFLPTKCCINMFYYQKTTSLYKDPYLLLISCFYTHLEINRHQLIQIFTWTCMWKNVHFLLKLV